MSHLDELDDFEAELELRLKREYSAVYSLFRYCVLTQDATYLCNKLDLQSVPQPAYPFFHVKMEDVWVWDKNRPTRMIPRVEVYTSADVTVEELKGDGDEEPDAHRRRAREAHERPRHRRRRRSATSARARDHDAARDRRRQHADRLRPVRRRRARPTSSASAPIRSHTADELAVMLRAFVELSALDGIVLSTTVPQLQREYESFAERWAGAELLVLGPGVPTGVPIRYDDPREVGPDRIANAVAARERHGAPAIVVDFGTSTNFDVVSRRGRVRRRRARAGDRDLDGRAVRARRAADEGAVHRAGARDRQDDDVGAPVGLVYGFAGQVDAIVVRIRDELGAPEAPAIATGGLAELIAPHSQTITEVDPELTLQGLRLVWERNRAA